MSSSTSSTEENKDENNDQTNINIPKNDNSMDFLEEVQSTAAPPPSYEDVVKNPQPTLPSYSQHDSPPPFPQPAENYNQTTIYPSPSNSNSKRKEYRGCCCCNSSQSSRNKNCGCGWIIVLIVFIILTTISIANNSACNNIALGPNPESFSFDPTNTIFRIDTKNARIKGAGNVNIFHQQQTQQVVNVQVFTGAHGVTPKFGTSNQNGIYELKVSQTGGFSIFNIPSRCMRMQVNVILPYLTTTDAPVPNTIQVKDLDLIMNDSVYPYQQKITLITDDGNIVLNGTSQNDLVLETKDGVVIFNNTAASNISVTTNDGNIQGYIKSISNGFSVLTESGYLDRLLLGIAPGVNNAKIKIQTNDGNVNLVFTNSSFSGSYNILSKDGSIVTNDNNGTVSDRNRITGNHNNGGNDLNISTQDGDVVVTF